MTLLGAGFQIGTTSTTSSVPMDLPLDELIKARAKTAKSISTNAERSAGTRQANKDAKMNARRGRSVSARPTAMQVEAAVTKQVNQTAIKKAIQMAKEKSPIGATTSLKEKVARRRQTRDVMAAGAKAVVAESGGAAANAPLQPTKNALRAARAALATAGYDFPPQCVIKVISTKRAGGTTTSDPPGKTNNTGPNRNGQQQQQQQQQQQPRVNNNRRRAGKKA